MGHSFQKRCIANSPDGTNSVIGAKTWPWLILSLKVIQKSQVLHVNNLTNIFYEKLMSICLTFFSKYKIKILSYKNILYHSLIDNMKN